MKGQQIKNYFENHSGAEELYFTANGYAFFDKNAANAHAQSLADEKITIVARGQADLLADDFELDLETSITVKEDAKDFTTEKTAEEIAAEGEAAKNASEPSTEKTAEEIAAEDEAATKEAAINAGTKENVAPAPAAKTKPAAAKKTAAKK